MSDNYKITGSNPGNSVYANQSNKSAPKRRAGKPDSSAGQYHAGAPNLHLYNAVNKKMKDHKFGPKMPFRNARGDIVDSHRYKNPDSVNYPKQISSLHINSINDDVNIIT